MKNLITEYIRDKNRTKTGVVIAELVGDTVVVSWAKCNMKLDKFDRDRGLNIARGRIVGYLKREAENKQHTRLRVPDSARSLIHKMKSRAVRHFKQANKVVTIPNESENPRTVFEKAKEDLSEIFRKKIASSLKS